MPDLPPVFLPYQQQLWQAVDSNRLTVVEKSRRTGYSWAMGAIAATYASQSRDAGGQDVLYMGYDQDMTREFIDYVGDWAKSIQAAASDVEEFVFTDPEKPEKDIKAFRIKFASGFEVIALPSVPRALRGKQGLVILDEAAFMDNLGETLKAALALLMWGGRVVVVSTHNGETNEFNTLINDIRGGRRRGVVLRLTFDEALAQGLFKRICFVKGDTWTPEKEAAWKAEILAIYGDNADEELNVVPNPATGAWLSAALIEARSVKDLPVLRYTAPAGMATWTETARNAEVGDWIVAHIDPVLTALPDEPYAVGEDFGRHRDLTVIWVLGISPQLIRHTRLVIELRDVPFDNQKQILHYVLSKLRFRKAILDAGGNGAHLAELTAQRFGARVEQLKFTEDWYRAEMPPLKSALEDAMLTIPMDRDIHTDLRNLKLIRGIARIADRTRVDEKATRHGDAAIALALAYAASRMPPEEYGYEAVGRHADDPEERWRRAPTHFPEDERRPASGWLPDLRGSFAA